MEEKKPGFGEKLEAFFAGRGFYAVLFLCVSVIGVSAWSMLSGSDGTTPDSSLSQPTPPVDDDALMSGLTEFPGGPAVIPPPTAVETMADTEPPTQIAAEPVTQTEAPPEPEQSASSFFIWPVVGEIENGYSMDKLVYNRTMADWRVHDGIDIAAAIGTAVLAVSDGVVEAVFADDLYGTTIIIAHSGELRSVYSNLAAEPSVSAGDTVSAGQIIASVGTTAICEANEAPHLHFSMNVSGESANPLDYLP